MMAVCDCGEPDRGDQGGSANVLQGTNAASTGRSRYKQVGAAEQSHRCGRNRDCSAKDWRSRIAEIHFYHACSAGISNGMGAIWRGASAFNAAVQDERRVITAVARIENGRERLVQLKLGCIDCCSGICAGVNHKKSALVGFHQSIGSIGEREHLVLVGAFHEPSNGGQSRNELEYAIGGVKNGYLTHIAHGSIAGLAVCADGHIKWLVE